MNLQENIQRIKSLILFEQKKSFFKTEEEIFTCAGCKRTDYKMFMVNDDLWKKYGNEDGTYCLKCFEKRMGRKLNKKDFKQYINALCNKNNPEVQKILMQP